MTVVSYFFSRLSNSQVQLGTHMGTMASEHNCAVGVVVPFDSETYCRMVEKPSIPGGMWYTSHTFCFASFALARLDSSQLRREVPPVGGTEAQPSLKLAAWYLL